LEVAALAALKTMAVVVEPVAMSHLAIIPLHQELTTSLSEMAV
jgi:hypothetical protein